MRRFMTVMILAVGVGSPIASAADEAPYALSDAYRDALAHDATYRGAVEQRLATQDGVGINRAGLLPELRYRYSKTRNNTFTERENARGEQENEHRRYSSDVSMFVLQQPLFDYSAYSQYQQSLADALASDESLRQQRLDLATRLLKAYTDAVYARDRRVIGKQRLEAMDALAKYNAHMLKYGEGTVTSTLETATQYQTAEAEWLDADAALEEALDHLAVMIGHRVDTERLPHLGSLGALPALDQEGPSVWRDRMLAQSPQIATLQHRLDAARYAEKAAFGEHLPIITAFAQDVRQDSNDVSEYRQRVHNEGTFGVQIDVPIFTGGRASSTVDQRGHQLEQAHISLDQAIEESLSLLDVAQRRLSTGRMRLQHLEEGVNTAHRLIDATEHSVRGGERSNANVLDAQQSYYSLQLLLARTRYDYLQSWLQVQTLTGQLNDDQLLLVTHCFTRSP